MCHLALAAFLAKVLHLRAPAFYLGYTRLFVYKLSGKLPYIFSREASNGSVQKDAPGEAFLDGHDRAPSSPVGSPAPTPGLPGLTPGLPLSGYPSCLLETFNYHKVSVPNVKLEGY